MKFSEESKGLLCVLAILLFCSLSLTHSPVSSILSSPHFSKSITLSTAIFNRQDLFLGRAVCGKFADANHRRFVCKNSNDRSKSWRCQRPSWLKVEPSQRILMNDFLGRIHPQNWKVGLRNGSETEYVANFRVSPDSHYSADISKMLRLQEPFQPPKDETLWHGDLAKATPSKLFMMLVDYSKAHGTGKHFEESERSSGTIQQISLVHRQILKLCP